MQGAKITYVGSVAGFSTQLLKKVNPITLQRFFDKALSGIDEPNRIGDDPIFG